MNIDKYGHIATYIANELNNFGYLDEQTNAEDLQEIISLISQLLEEGLV